jgi:hypothetical protein
MSKTDAADSREDRTHTPDISLSAEAERSGGTIYRSPLMMTCHPLGVSLTATYRMKKSRAKGIKIPPECSYCVLLRRSKFLQPRSNPKLQLLR